MKHEILPPATDKTVIIPKEAIDKAGFKDVPILTAYSEENAVIVLKEKMTAFEIVGSVNALHNITVGLLIKLAKAAGVCDDYCDCDDDCFGCEMKAECEGLSIPPCLLEEAGISVFSALDIKTEDGVIKISQSPDKIDPLDMMPQSVLDTLVNAGICLKTLRRLIKDNKVIDE